MTNTSALPGYLIPPLMLSLRVSSAISLSSSLACLKPRGDRSCQQIGPYWLSVTFHLSVSSQLQPFEIVFLCGQKAHTLSSSVCWPLIRSSRLLFLVTILGNLPFTRAGARFLRVGVCGSILWCARIAAADISVVAVRGLEEQLALFADIRLWRCYPAGLRAWVSQIIRAGVAASWHPSSPGTPSLRGLWLCRADSPVGQAAFPET